MVKYERTPITSGGSQAVFFKINTLGEDTFLDQCIQSIERYESSEDGFMLQNGVDKGAHGETLNAVMG